MIYNKAIVEVVYFDYREFMMGSLDSLGHCNDYTDSYNHHCGSYQQGTSCNSWTTPSFGGGSCSTYDGSHCNGYTDSNHSTGCAGYGVSCAHF